MSGALAAPEQAKRDIDTLRDMWQNDTRRTCVMFASSHEPDDKSARLSCRIRPQIKERAEVAARLLGQSITDFTESALDEKAQHVLAENERMVLSDQAFQEFVAAISGEPEKPTPKLLSAVERYKQHRSVTDRNHCPS